MAENQNNNRNNNNLTYAVQNNLKIDGVVSSHPEIGPTPPDGGYGWIILLGTVITQITIPSLVSAYGVLILFENLKEGYEENEIFKIWEKKTLFIPVLMVVFWLLLEPWSRTIILISNRPKVVSISGVFLIGAGVLLSNFSIENEDDGVIINVFSGILIGLGASLTTQQSEILLNHYFRKKIVIVISIYKTSIVIGNVAAPLVMGVLCSYCDASTSIVIYAAIVLQMSIILLTFSRPTYVVQALRRNYKILEEAAEDEDETIYSSQLDVSGQTKRKTQEQQSNNESTSREGTSNDRNIENDALEDDRDETVIGTFNSGNTTREISRSLPILERYDTTNNPFGSNFQVNLDRIERFEEAPQALYRETTIANDVTSDYIFTFDPPATNPGTVRRTANTKKNFLIFVSVLKDLKFYSYTHLLFCNKFSSLVFCALYPAYLSQQQPDMVLMTVIMMVAVTHIGAMCLSVVMSFISIVGKYKWIIRICSLTAAFGFLALAETSAKSWMVIYGILAIFSTNSMYIAMKPIYNNMTLDFESQAVAITANFITALIILFIMLVHNYNYATCFKIAACINLFMPFVSFCL